MKSQYYGIKRFYKSNNIFEQENIDGSIDYSDILISDSLYDRSLCENTDGEVVQF